MNPVMGPYPTKNRLKNISAWALCPNRVDGDEDIADIGSRIEDKTYPISPPQVLTHGQGRPAHVLVFSYEFLTTGHAKMRNLYSLSTFGPSGHMKIVFLVRR